MTSPTTQQRFPTCDFCDTHKNDSFGDFRALSRVFRPFGGVLTFCGPVGTVKCFDDNSLVKAAVDGNGLVVSPVGRVPAVLVLVVLVNPCAARCSAATWAPRQSGVAVQIQGVWLASVSACAAEPWMTPLLMASLALSGLARCSGLGVCSGP